ncbi:MAG: ATP-binding cassette domain-containing protein [Betaproteobacteria bacterium]|nr:ATP-binding cassette domain-containing protein [Betaproteobacteria bacterium]
MSLLQVNGLRKKYKSRTVVRDVSFEVKSGEVVGLLGPNGAGKTTCFYMIVGLVERGRRRNQHRRRSADAHADPSPRTRLGLSYLPQEISVFRKLNVAEISAPCSSCSPSPRNRSSSGWRSCSASCTSPTCATTRPFALWRRAAPRGNLPAHWPPARASSCSTSPLPGSTRSPCSTSRRSSVFSRNAASAF